jgi:hypothetical protein
MILSLISSGWPLGAWERRAKQSEEPGESYTA